MTAQKSLRALEEMRADTHIEPSFMNQVAAYIQSLALPSQE